jgi:hypothetical protein
MLKLASLKKRLQEIAEGRIHMKSSTVERYVRKVKHEDPEWWQNFKGKAELSKEYAPQQQPIGKVLYDDRKGIGKDEVRETRFLSDKPAHSAEEMAKMCNISLERYEVDRMITSQWTTSEKFMCWQFKVWWRLRDKPTAEDAIEAYKKFANELRPVSRLNFPVYKHEKGERLLEVSVFDAHIGRLSWSKETCGGNYDLKIATKRYLETNAYFFDLFKNASIDRVLLPIGNDFFNSNSAKNDTFSGTLQDEDARWAKTYMAGMEIIMQTIEMWRQMGHVDVVFVAGNHDKERLFYLGYNMETLYRNVEDVTIYNSPKDVHTYTYGRNLLMFTHRIANYKKAQSLVINDARREMATADCIEFHTGHFHTEKTVECVDGVTLREIPSIAEPSEWESSSKYRGLRKAMAFVFDKQGGLSDIRYRNFK